MIDLHTHSTASDGTFSPTELVNAAAREGLSAVALTDHDTVAGLSEAADASRAAGIVVVPGVELSAELPDGCLHIVGLWIDRHCQALLDALQWMLAKRVERNELIMEKLVALGLPIRMADLTPPADGASIGRPHIASLLMRHKIVDRFDVAFQKYLARGKPAYVSKKKFSPEEAIHVILAAGGIPVLAHPDQTGRKGRQLSLLVGELTEMGLGAIEVYCAGYHRDQIANYTALANQFSLLRSGGTDFHGAIKPDIRLGRGFGQMCMDDSLLGPLRDWSMQRASRIA